MPKSEAQVIAKLKELCDAVIEFDNKAGVAAAAAATTDLSSDASKYAIEAREFAGGAFGCYMEAMSLFSELPNTPDALPSSVSAMVEEMVQSAKGMEDEGEETAVDIIENIEWYSNNTIKSAKKADKSCIRLKRVHWHPSTGV